MWTKNADPFGQLNWVDAMSRCSSFSISGIGGWRLPSKDELVALSHCNERRSSPFTRVVQASFYWSSTAYADYTELAWLVDMNDGDVHAYGKSVTRHVWPVRAGQ